VLGAQFNSRKAFSPAAPWQGKLIFPHWNSFPGLSSRRIPLLKEFFAFFFDFHLVTTEAKADVSIARGVEARHTEAI